MSFISIAKWYVLAALLFFCVGFLHAENPPKFLNLSVTQGLSQNSIWSIIRDKQGFLWFATDDGLNKYDGYRFRVYRHIKNDSTSLPWNTIRALLQDRAGKIWIGTSVGLSVYDPATDHFSSPRSKGEHPVGLRSTNIECLAEDDDGGIWVGSRTDGLYRIDPAANTHRWFSHDSTDAHSISGNGITTLYCDRSGTVWIGTAGSGVNRYDRSAGTFTVFAHDEENAASLIDNAVQSLFEDSKGRFWIGTMSHGICSFDRNTGECRAYIKTTSHPIWKLDTMTVLSITEDASGRIVYGTYGAGVKFLDPSTGAVVSWENDVRNVNSLAGNEIISLFSDDAGALWIGTYSNGISKYEANGEHFHTYRNESPRTGLFSDNNVRSLYRDAKGNIWVGTAKGMDIYDPSTGQCEHYKHIPGSRSSLVENFVRAIHKDTKGVMWIGTRGGVMTFDRETKRFTLWSDKSSGANPLLHTDIRAILEDTHGTLWFGTSAGLCAYNRETGRHTVYTELRNDVTSLSSLNVRSLFEDHTGTLWVGTYGAGINKFNHTAGTFTRYVNDPADSTSLNNNNASPIIEDRSGNLWIGTYGGGINKFDPRTGKFSALTESDGLTNNTVFGLLADTQGNLWISTFSGVSRFDPTTYTFHNYTTASGLQSEEFNLNCSFKDADGTMFFGGHDGFNEFNPARIRENTLVPPVYVTGMSIFNKPVRWDTVMTMKRHIVLPHDENSFAFDFVALNFRKPELNRYKYKLEGFDDEWSPAGTDRKASYTNLVPGEYVFRVLGSNNDDLWNTTGASIAITITPPFWKTWWAYSLYIVCFAWTAVGSLSFIRKRHRTKLFIERQQFEKERLEKINEEIAQERILLRTVIDNIPMAVYAKDADTRMVIANAVDLAFFNKPESDVLGRTVLELFPLDWAQHLMADDLEVIRSGKSVIEREEFVTNGKGENRWMLTSKLPWRDNSGAIVGLVGISLDITERRRLEQQLLQSQKLEGVGTLAGGIAHDFNNLLAMVLGSAELLKRHLADHPELQKYVDRIIDASERGTSISRQLLIFSRPNEAELKPISLTHTIAGLKEMLKHFLPRSITIETELESDNAIIMGDAGQIHQALLNLALNAGDAMHNSGRMTIREFTASPDVIKKQFSIDVSSAYTAVSVSDTGVGIDEKIRTRIFDPFFTTKPPGKGTGLGLGIVHGIVKNHNGLISVESTPGVGTTFTLYFPPVPCERIALAPEVGGSGRPQAGTILVVDDEQILREMLFEFLTELGYTVHLASDGTEALTKFNEQKDTIDVVITDLGMPEMGGEELYKKLRCIDDTVKVVVSSGYLDGTTKENLLHMGIKHVLIKPFKMNEIQAALWSVLHAGGR